jgi:L-alanine-DL-glutamate epimerase-like enolase superfamily enzyme
MPVVLDESLRSFADLERHLACAGTWIPNLRVSKLGGLLESIALAQACEAASVPFIVGGHVGETSLMTRAALTVARSAKGCLAQEGGFGTLLLFWEPPTPAVMFGHGGRLEVRRHAGPGFGLVPRTFRRARWWSWCTAVRALWRLLVTRRPWVVDL